SLVTKTMPPPLPTTPATATPNTTCHHYLLHKDIQIQTTHHKTDSSIEQLEKR
ncbi:unnamed protein product, partial [Ilex paraguariensis]